VPLFHCVSWSLLSLATRELGLSSGQNSETAYGDRKDERSILSLFHTELQKSPSSSMFYRNLCSCLLSFFPEGTASKGLSWKQIPIMLPCWINIWKPWDYFYSNSSDLNSIFLGWISEQGLCSSPCTKTSVTPPPSDQLWPHNAWTPAQSPTRLKLSSLLDNSRFPGDLKSTKILYFLTTS
jgi:hypothetical protein